MAAEALPDGGGTQHPAPARGGQEEHRAGGDRGETVLAQEPGQLGGAEG